MLKHLIVGLVWLSLISLGFAASPALAQDALSAPITQADIDGFLNIYGHDNPPAAVESAQNVNVDRLNVVTRRLSTVYVLRGQHTEEQSLLEKLASIKVPHSVSSDEYNLYRANDDKLKPVFAKFLGAYTLRLPNSLAERDTVEASNVVNGAAPENFDFDQNEGYGPPDISGTENTEPTINTEQLPEGEVTFGVPATES
ncbi:MAG: hypothetical protein LBF38_01145 [Deltaproteobacteria bacterium]|jgi:hypothetical protein|nr:hypothetical protein [Deltaproteobacteria bacterium]